MKRWVRGFVIVGILGVCLWAHAAEEKDDPKRALALHYYRGVVYFEAGRYDNAAVEFQAVASIDPAYKRVQDYLKRSLDSLDETRARTLETDRKTVKDGGTDLYFIGKAYYEKGDYDRAIEAFKAVLVKNPNDRFANYYLNLCETAQGALSGGKKIPSAQNAAQEILTLDKEIAYMKDDIRSQEDTAAFFESKAEHRARREELIRKKEEQLAQQEALLEEEREDYLAQKRIVDRAVRVERQSEKWRTMKERLESRQPGTPADLMEFPALVNRAEQYYAYMKEALRESRWNAAGLNALSAAMTISDALLVHGYGIKSAYPTHANVATLISQNVKHASVSENLGYLRGMLNVEKIVQDEERPFTRSEAVYLADKAEKIMEWCKSVLP